MPCYSDEDVDQGVQVLPSERTQDPRQQEPRQQEPRQQEPRQQEPWQRAHFNRHRLIFMLYGSALAVTLLQLAALDRVHLLSSSASHLYDDAALAPMRSMRGANDDGDGDGEHARGFGIAAMPPIDDERAERAGSTTIFVRGTSPNGTGVSCECNVAESTDCLRSSLPCVPRTLRSLRRSVARGVAIRSALRETLTFDNNRPKYSVDPSHLPIGKGTQYTAMDAWDQYTRNLPLSKRYYTGKSIFVNATAYEYCVKWNLRGKDCFFRPIWEGDHDGKGEDEKYVDLMDKDAIEHAENEAIEGAGRALEIYRNVSRSISESDSEAEVDNPKQQRHHRRKGKGNPLALDHLLVFAHLLRMHFDVRQHILDSYNKYLVTVPATVHSISGKAPEGERSKNKHTNDNASDEAIVPLRVGLHVRRADSCEHEKETDGKGADGMHRYLNRASDVHSGAQVTGKRYCYDTRVYVDALRRIHRSMRDEDAPGGEGGDGRTLPMEIYLSTDYAGQLLYDIERNFPDLYASCTWKYLNFPREAFVYESAIEMTHNKHKQGSLGEFAVEDLWHLGHAQVFVGHIGSRFGKVGWLLATARHNSFVPYFTPDGKSYCCEIDENCGESMPLINSMEHCLLFAHELVSAMEGGIPEDADAYWKVGSTVRRRFVQRKKESYM